MVVAERENPREGLRERDGVRRQPRSFRSILMIVRKVLYPIANFDTSL